MKKAIPFLLVVSLLVLSACENPFFEDSVEDEDEDKGTVTETFEIEASLSWRNDWLPEAAGLARDLDNEFASVPGNPTKAASTRFYADSFVTTSDPLVGIFPAQRWQSEVGDTAASVVLYYKMPGVDFADNAAYDGSEQNIYQRVKRDDDVWSKWFLLLDNPASNPLEFEVKNGTLYFKSGYGFAAKVAGTWFKRQETITVEIALFETPVVPDTVPPFNVEAYYNAYIAARPRIKSRTFTVDLSNVRFNSGTTPPP
jgi:hypothetical protein